jgi:hypothetical protein
MVRGRFHTVNSYIITGAIIGMISSLESKAKKNTNSDQAKREKMKPQVLNNIGENRYSTQNEIFFQKCRTIVPLPLDGHFLSTSFIGHSQMAIVSLLHAPFRTSSWDFQTLGEQVSSADAAVVVAALLQAKSGRRAHLLEWMAPRR